MPLFFEWLLGEILAVQGTSVKGASPIVRLYKPD